VERATACDTGQMPRSPLAQEQVEQQQVGVDPVALGRCIPNPKPPDSSAPIIAPVSIIFGPMNLKPTGTSWVSMP
jgi:hypothetical protein